MARPTKRQTEGEAVTSSERLPDRSRRALRADHEASGSPSRSSRSGPLARGSASAVLSRMSGLLFAGLGAVLCADRRPDSCVSAVERESWKDAALLCAAEYQRSPSPLVALRFARASLQNGDGETCERVASPFAEGPWAAEANQLVGHAARTRKDPLVALRHFGQAIELHERAGDQRGLARDAQGLAGVALVTGHYADALELLDVAAEAANRAGDRRNYTHMTRGEVLFTVGDYVEAERSFYTALDQPMQPIDRAWTLFKFGLFHIETQRDALAQQNLQAALNLARQIDYDWLAKSSRLNLAWLARRAGRLDEADAVFASHDGDDDPDAVAYNRGLIAFDRGEFDRAAAFLQDAENAQAKGDRAWHVPYRAGLIAERRGRTEEARAAYRRSLDALTRLRDRAGPLAAHVLAAHRMPHERLVSLSAREGRWHDVLSIVLSLDLSMVLATNATPHDLSAEGKPTQPVSSAVHHLQRQWLDVELGGKGTGEFAEVERTIEAWRGRRLVVLVPGGDQLDPARGRLWRLEIANGDIKGVDVGPLDRLERLASDLEADPDNRTAARALGEAMIPHSPPGEAIDVLALGPVARAPLGALRHGDALVASRTPLARVLGLRAWPRPSTRANDTGVVVLGDPLGNLPAAATEATAVAERLNARALLGFEADREALASARGAALLHVASHAVDGSDGSALLLAGGKLRAREISSLGPTARLVVLSSCASASSRDGSGWGSLAAAFLGAGAESVIATQWSILDKESASVVEALYDADVGRDLFRDPTAALAAAQARLEGAVPSTVWAAFTVVRAPPVVGQKVSRRD
jgi:tetratricopeptide (TPR) repeat protein